MLIFIFSYSALEPPSPGSKEKTPEGEGDLVNNQRKKLIKSEDEWQKNTGFINSGTMCR